MIRIEIDTNRLARLGFAEFAKALESWERTKQEAVRRGLAVHEWTENLDGIKRAEIRRLEGAQR
ncbi:MAG: hypothetical protein B9S38_02385 [Verrucomicrobiia bacterium Tous-C4TDCM]|nr:MAG: hypothetical protein B9S38_02385 [Verrucomicrobiae bacterium Tous-C4TDCM]